MQLGTFPTASIAKQLSWVLQLLDLVSGDSRAFARGKTLKWVLAPSLNRPERRVSPECLGYAILSFEDNSTVMYLCSIEYTPSLDRDLNLLDPDLAIDWPVHARDGSLIDYQHLDKDKVAPLLAQAIEGGYLPSGLRKSHRPMRIELRGAPGLRDLHSNGDLTFR